MGYFQKYVIQLKLFKQTYANYCTVVLTEPANLEGHDFMIVIYQGVLTGVVMIIIGISTNGPIQSITVKKLFRNTNHHLQKNANIHTAIRKALNKYLKLIILKPQII
jgi:hypothetical protein